MSPLCKLMFPPIEEEITGLKTYRSNNLIKGATGVAMKQDSPVFTDPYGKGSFGVIVVWTSRDPALTTTAHSLETA